MAMGDVGNCRNGECGMDLKPDDFEWATTEILRIADICCNGRVVSCALQNTVSHHFDVLSLNNASIMRLPYVLSIAYLDIR